MSRHINDSPQSFSDLPPAVRGCSSRRQFISRLAAISDGLTLAAPLSRLATTTEGTTFESESPKDGGWLGRDQLESQRSSPKTCGRNADIAPLVKSCPLSAVSTKGTPGRTPRFKNLCQETCVGAVLIQTSSMRSKWWHCR